MSAPVAHIIYAIIELYSFIPVIIGWVCCKTIISCGFCGSFIIISAGEHLSRKVIEVVVGRKIILIVTYSKIFCPIWNGVCIVFPGQMVWDKIYYNLKPRIMSAQQKLLKLRHSVGNRICQIWIYIIIVLNGIRGAGLTLNYRRVVFTDTVFLERGFCSVFNDTCIPDMGYTQRMQVLKNILCYG